MPAETRETPFYGQLSASIKRLSPLCPAFPDRNSAAVLRRVKLPEAAAAAAVSPRGCVAPVVENIFTSLRFMSSHSSAGQNQSEEKAYVTPSLSLRRRNLTLEEIDQAMYFWTGLSVALPLTFSEVSSSSRSPRVLSLLSLNLSNRLRLYF